MLIENSSIYSFTNSHVTLNFDKCKDYIKLSCSREEKQKKKEEQTFATVFMSVPAKGVIYSKDRILSAEIVAFVIGGASRFSNYLVKGKGNEGIVGDRVLSVVNNDNEKDSGASMSEVLQIMV
jgi:hypothetical protein